MKTLCNLNEFKILYQDNSLVAIHKPAGLLVHRSPIDKHETQFAVQLTRDTIGQIVFPVHRLDKPTSGILIFALNSFSAKHLSEQFASHSLQKTYVALCRGWTPESGMIDKPLMYQKDKIADKFKQPGDTLQTAETHFKTLAQTTVNQPLGKFETQRYSLVELSPRTGRKHQLRRHLNYLSHPIIGDVNHGDRHHNHFFADWLDLHRLYLAATRLSFIHPQTLQAITLNSPLEDNFQHTLTQLWSENTLDSVL